MKLQGTNLHLINSAPANSKTEVTLGPSIYIVQQASFCHIQAVSRKQKNRSCFDRHSLKITLYFDTFYRDIFSRDTKTLGVPSKSFLVFALNPFCDTK